MVGGPKERRSCPTLGALLLESKALNSSTCQCGKDLGYKTCARQKEGLLQKQRQQKAFFRGNQEMNRDNVTKFPFASSRFVMNRRPLSVPYCKLETVRTFNVKCFFAVGYGTIRGRLKDSHRSSVTLVN
jgi:hypothetical protein